MTRVILLRSFEQAAPMKRDLEELGASVLSFPTIAFKAIEDSVDLIRGVECFDEYSFVLFSSANAVRFCKRWMDPKKLSLKDKKVLVVGDATRKACEALGIDVDWCSEVFTMASASEQLIAEQVVTGERGLFPCSTRSADTAEKLFSKQSTELDRVDVYETVLGEPPRALLIEELSALGLHYCLATSPSTLQNLLQLLSEKELQIVRKEVQFLSIGPVTSDAARDLGLHVIAEARPHSAKGLIRALIESVNTSNEFESF